MKDSTEGERSEVNFPTMQESRQADSRTFFYISGALKKDIFVIDWLYVMKMYAW